MVEYFRSMYKALSLIPSNAKIRNGGLSLYQFPRCTGIKSSRSCSVTYWAQCLIMIGLSSCLLMVCECSLLTVSPWKAWSTVSSSFHAWYYQIQSHVAKNKMSTYFVPQVLAQSTCMNCNGYTKYERPAPPSKGVRAFSQHGLFIKRSAWAWQLPNISSMIECRD